MFFTCFWRTLLISSATLPEFSVTTWIMTIVGLVIFIALSLYVFRRLKEASKEEPFLSPHAILSNFRDLRDKGELSEEEFRKIKLLLADKIAGEEKNTNP